MYSTAMSRFNSSGGTNLMASSDPDARMLVSAFVLQTFTCEASQTHESEEESTKIALKVMHRKSHKKIGSKWYPKPESCENEGTTKNSE